MMELNQSLRSPSTSILWTQRRSRLGTVLTLRFRCPGRKLLVVQRVVPKNLKRCVRVTYIALAREDMFLSLAEAERDAGWRRGAPS